MAPLYARFYPSKKPAKAAGQEQAPLRVTESAESPRPATVNKSKPSKAANGTSDLGISNAEQGTPVEQSKAPKKPKKRKRDATPEDEGTTPKKHRTVLSKFEKASKRAQEQAQQPKGTEEEQEAKPEVVLRDLQPLPQPAPVPDANFEPTFSVLPTWLAEPITVEASQRVPFDKLGVESSFLKKLEKQGYTEALAVQSALLPMLQPGYEQHLGDICVSAKTGSGKTLAYLLPIVEALKDRTTPVLSAIIVVPTRQLVDQALQVAEELCAGTKIKVGTAVGNVPFATERKQLVKLRAQYDPRRAAVLHEKANSQGKTGFVENRAFVDDLMTMPDDHVPRYDSGVDILICTPGRLVEHIESTTGFLLRSIKWLVIDEADQLLNQNFQGWATVLIDALHGETPEDMMDAQERLRKQRQALTRGPILPSNRQLTKVILSATMEKDLTKLGMLKLKRPKFVAVQDEPEQHVTTADGDSFELPSTLDEFAVPVGVGQKKPLYLLYLLMNHIFRAPDGDTGADEEKKEEDSDDSSSDDSATETLAKPSIAQHKNRVLVFTKSNESASRLSHLLSVLEPSLKEYLKTMSPAATAKASKKLLRSFSSGSIKILVASDAASRGLDIADITHVVNYDIPTSNTNYVHRVGRTARAEKAGEAWTLFTKTEAAWFWNQIARGDNIRRGGKKVKRVEWKERSVEYNRRRTYEAALAQLQGAVEGADV